MSAPNNRAALLAGLRTGGVRSVSNGGNAAGAVPQTAGPTASSFTIPRQPPPSTIVEDDSGATFTSYQPHQRHMAPATAAVHDSGRFQQQQNINFFRQAAAQRAALSAAAVTPFQPFSPHPQAGAAALQMQVMQMEIMRLQALHHAQQAQQYQFELLAQAQQQQQARPRRNFTEPATAGPTTTSFNHVAPPFRPRVQEQAPAAADAPPPPVPMTAALGGKFGSRSLPAGLGSASSSTSAPSVAASSSQLLALPEEDAPKRHGTAAPSNTPTTPSYGHTTVISGGTSLGISSVAAAGPPPSSTVTPSKSDSAVSWRRATALPSGGSSSSPSLRLDRMSPPLPTAAQAGGGGGLKTRPQPLRFSIALSAPAVPDIAIIEDDEEGAESEESDTGRRGANGGGHVASRSGSEQSPASEPATPPSAASSLSSDAAAASKPYDGLGIGKPMMSATPVTATTARLPSSSAVRQPRGPPSGADELGPRNFATRIRRKAIGGLGVLMGARERREGATVEVEAY